MIFAIGDIHGQLEMLLDLHARIEADAAGRDYRIIHVGDLVDRGANSKAVIEYLMNGQLAGKPWDVLKGNHDRYVSNFYRTGATTDPDRGTLLSWFDPRMGGAETLKSFGIDHEDAPFSQRNKIPLEMVEWIEQLPLMIQTESCVFVHAGIRPNIAFENQVEQDLIWIRGPVFFDHPKSYGKLIVHGHTIVESVTHYGNRLAIDTGAGKFQALSCVLIENDAIYKLGKKGRFTITPPEGWSIFGDLS